MEDDMDKIYVTDVKRNVAFCHEGEICLFSFSDGSKYRIWILDCAGKIADKVWDENGNELVEGLFEDEMDAIEDFFIGNPGRFGLILLPCHGGIVFESDGSVYYSELYFLDYRRYPAATFAFFLGGFIFVADEAEVTAAVQRYMSDKGIGVLNESHAVALLGNMGIGEEIAERVVGLRGWIALSVKEWLDMTKRNAKWSILAK